MSIPTEVQVDLMETLMDHLDAAYELLAEAEEALEELAPKARAWDEVYALAQNDEAAPLEKLDAIWATSQVEEGDEDDEPDP